ncbi:MAG: capsular biosynthesis protein [Bacteroidales bacterium]|nr:capsular biosynthesis protein [Bacteroidales bacterium]
MLFFSKKYTLEDSGLLKDATDWHCHLLPGVDDGVQELEETLAILADYDRLGVAHVWFTPHVMEDVPNSPATLQPKFEQVKAAYNGNVKLHLAAENMLDNLFDERLAKKEVAPIGERGDHLLVETSYFTPPFDMDDKLVRVKSAGFFPLLAHPERYVYMDQKDYDRLKKDEIKFQLNLYSLVGLYGPAAQEKARKLLKKGYYNAIGSDTHRHRQLLAALGKKSLSSAEIDAITSIIGNCTV